MMKSKIIIKYLAGELSVFEKQKFEKELLADPTLRKEVALQKAMRESIIGRLDEEEVLSDPDYQDLINVDTTPKPVSKKQELEIRRFVKSGLDLKDESDNIGPKTLYLNQDTGNRPKKKIFLTIGTTAAAIVILLGIFFIGDIDGERLYSKFYVQFEPKAYSHRGGFNSEFLFSQGIRAYKKSDFSLAIESFSNIEAGDKYYSQSLFYLPLSLMGLKEYEKSVELFLTYLNQDRYYETEAYWYLSLSYIYLEDFENAKPILEKLSSTKSIYQLPSRKLLRRISLLDK